MFRKLRNKLLVTNLAVTAALVVCCLTAIYITTYTFINNQISNQLDRTIQMTVQRMNNDLPVQPAAGPPPESRLNKPKHVLETDRFRSEFSVYADADGNVIKANTNFNMEESDYSNVVKSIIQSRKTDGSTKLDIDSWAYRAVPYDTGYIVAFAQNSSQKKILFGLVIILVFAAVASIGITFFISLLSANRSIKPIEDAYNKQKQFVADASHELRTPLASISANTDVLLSKPERTIEQEKKWLIYIKDETERMTRLTNDLLYLAKTDSDDGEKKFSSVSFSDIVEDVVLESEAVAFENNISLNYTIEPDLCVKASREGLKQLVLILVDNALKYTPEGRAVQIKLQSGGEKAVFSVENTGEIDKEDLPHIFERFYRADKSRSRKSGGYGLGLAIADSLCKSFGGRIYVSSKNKKTVFRFELERD